MIYLLIIVVIAAAGIARLWLQQRKQQARMFSVAEFREGLEKIASPAVTPKPIAASTGDSGPTPARSRSAHQPPTPLRPRPLRGPRQPLDAERRAAAKRRLEARRAARSHVGR